MQDADGAKEIVKSKIPVLIAELLECREDENLLMKIMDFIGELSACVDIGNTVGGKFVSKIKPLLGAPNERVRRVALVSLIGISVHQSEVMVEQGIIEEIMNNLKKII